MKRKPLLTPEQAERIRQGQRAFVKAGVVQRQLSPRYVRKFAGLKAVLAQLRGNNNV